MKRRKTADIIKNDYMLNTVSKVLTMLIGVVASVFSTRFLGVENKGVYMYILQASKIGIIIFNLGIYQSYSYNYKKYGKDTLKKYSDVFLLQFLVCGALACLVSAVSGDFTVIMIAVLVPFSMIKLQYENIVLVENLRLSVFLHVFNQVLLAVCYAVLYFTADSNVLYIVMLTVLVDAFTVVFYLFRLRCVPKIWQVDWGFLKQVVRFGFLPMLSLLLARINYSTDIFFLEHMGLSQELGQYSFATTIIDYVWMLPIAFKEVLFSKSAKKFDRKNIILSVKISLASTLCCLVGFALLGKPLISLVYGSDFLPSYEIVLILIVGALPMTMYQLLGTVLVSQGKRGAHFASLAVSAALNVVANIYAIPIWGMYGAAWASVISYTMCGTVLTVYFCKTYSFGLKELLVPSKSDIAKLKKLIKRK